MVEESPAQIVNRLVEFQRKIRAQVIRSRATAGLAAVKRTTAADTIYELDAQIDPLVEEFFTQWGKTTPLVLVAEGLHDCEGREGPVVFPRGLDESQARLRIIVDPIDGTRGLMYDKRSAWSLAAVAPNKGDGTRLRDAFVSVMTELPTSKLGFADVLSAFKGDGVKAHRVDLRNDSRQPLAVSPSEARTIDHGFATISNFFPGTKVLASELMEHLVLNLVGPADVTQGTVFDDQYISTGGQFYELIVGHDRFNADLRPIFYQILNTPAGLCCHPYDCAGWLIAEEAGVILTDGCGNPLNGPMDTTTGLSWAGYANANLRRAIEPVLMAFLSRVGTAHRI